MKVVCMSDLYFPLKSLSNNIFTGAGMFVKTCTEPQWLTVLVSLVSHVVSQVMLYGIVHYN